VVEHVPEGPVFTEFSCKRFDFDLTASSQTLHPGKLERVGRPQRQGHKNPVMASACRRHTGEAISLDEVDQTDSVYKMNTGGPGPVARQTARSSHTLHPARQTGTSPTQYHLYRRRPWDVSIIIQQDVVDGIKCHGRIEQGIGLQNVRQYFQHGCLGREVCPICRLQAWQKVCH